MIFTDISSLMLLEKCDWTMLILSIQKWWHWESLFLVGTSCVNSEQSRALHKVAVVGFIQTCFTESSEQLAYFVKGGKKWVLETFVHVKRMWIHLGGKTKNNLLLFADGKGLRSNGQKKKTVIYSFFPAIMQVDTTMTDYHMAYFWVHSRAILLYLWKSNRT
jgi:hypothetical protein